MNRNGFSIVEALIAMSVLSIVLAGIVPVFVFNAATNLKSQQRTEAIAVAQNAMDGLRQKDFTQWPTSGVSSNVALSGTTYSVKTLYCTNGLNYCNSGARHTRVEVSQNDKILYQVENVYTQLNATE